ncbi:MAG: hypothetical protein LQ338_000792 [Usnochroma carphineum]|nr:MAG: hypothetical protein LQ338_000792 [Usnochroma carphineum]
MPRARNKPQLGESWVVEDASESSEDSGSEGVGLDEESRHPQQQMQFSKTPQRRETRTGSRASTDPELIMPSMHDNSVDGSWYTGEQPQLRRSPRKRSGKTKSRGEYGGSSPRFVPVKEAAADETRRSRKQGERSVDMARDFVLPMFTWCYDVLGGAMSNLKTPISALIAVYFLIGLLILLRNMFTTSIYTALSPICRIPGSSLLNLPMCHTTSIPSPHHSSEGDPSPVEFDQLINVQAQFESILEETSGGVSLPLDMKRSETSLRDLRTIIRYSTLPSKNELVFEFNGFIETAGIASSDLQKFNSHVGRAVDNILATARWTKRVLDGVAMEQGSRGLISAFFNDKLLAPFQPLRFTEAKVLQQYTEHTRAVENEINRLIDEAQALLDVLRNLDDRLDVIHSVAVRDDLHAQGSKEEVMSQLWTMLGGNRKALGKFDSQLKLLNHVNGYRQTAIAHVAGTMLKLQAMGAELEELRERVGTVELVGERRGVPLSVHIENIELGVERLEERRNWAKGVENEQRRKALVNDPARDGRKEIAGS